MTDSPNPRRSLGALDAVDLVVSRWTDGGVTMGWYRNAAQVRDLMPDHARALDRLAAERPDEVGFGWRLPDPGEEV